MKNPELVKAFKAAKRLIVQGKVHYICHGLRVAYDNGSTNEHAKDAAVTLVGMRLSGHVTLESWLQRVHGIRCDPRRPYQAKIKATRIAWLNALIKEFS